MSKDKAMFEKEAEAVKKVAGGGKKLLEEFKAFISRGNVVDMAVGVVVGTSFTAIVNSIVNSIIMPFVGFLVGGMSFDELKIVLPAAEGAEPAVIAYGAFIQAVVNFLIISAVVFLVVKLMNSFKRKKVEEEEKAPEEPKVSDEVLLLTEIRDLLKK